MFRGLERYEARNLGLPYPVVLTNAVEEEIDDAGNVVGIHVPEMEGLVAAVALTRCLIPLRLTGAEIRFIRSVIGKPAKQFAEDLEMDPATYSRWENDRQQVGAWADKQVRQAAVILLRDKAPHLRCDPADVVGLRFGPDADARIVRFEMIRLDGGSGSSSAGSWDSKFERAA